MENEHLQILCDECTRVARAAVEAVLHQTQDQADALDGLTRMMRHKLSLQVQLGLPIPDDFEQCPLRLAACVTNDPGTAAMLVAVLSKATQAAIPSTSSMSGSLSSRQARDRKRVPSAVHSMAASAASTVQIAVNPSFGKEYLHEWYAAQPWEQLRQQQSSSIAARSPESSRSSSSTSRQRSRSSTKTGRNRVAFTPAEREALESEYTVTIFPTPAQYEDIALRLDIAKNRVISWFNGRRTKDRQSDPDRVVHMLSRLSSFTPDLHACMLDSAPS